MSAARENFVAIADSERFAIPGARLRGAADPQERVVVSVYLRRRRGAPELPSPEDIGARLSVADRSLGREEIDAANSADPVEMERVVQFASAHRLDVLKQDLVQRSLQLSGSVAALQAAFGVELRSFDLAGRHYRVRTGAIHVPAELGDIVEGVFGLDNRPVGRCRLRPGVRASLTVAVPVIRASALPSHLYLPTTIANLYRYPAGTNGEGQTVAILAFNDPHSHGGYSPIALRTYFQDVLGTSIPSIVDVVVHGQGNDPGSDDGSDLADSTGEIMLDIQVIGAAAPAAKIVVYFTQFTSQGWVDAIHTILSDTTHAPSIISISYGNPEDDVNSAWTAGAILKVNEAFRAAALMGITICCASGDDGTRDQAGGPRAHADFPASSPYVVGCGGTRVLAAGGQIVQETVWNDGPGSATGGGISRIFPLPPWQSHVGVPPSANPDRRIGRGVPDVSGLADPQTGAVIITVDGQHLAAVGGTSVTAPLWAALFARINQALGGRLGYFNPLLYRYLAHGVLRDIVFGSNGAYQANPGWDPCTGLGSPDGERLLLALRTTLNAPQWHRLSPFAGRLQKALEDLRVGLSSAYDFPELHERAQALSTFAARARAGGWSTAEAWDQWVEACRDYQTTAERGVAEGAPERRATQAYREYLAQLRSAWVDAEPSTLDLGAVMAAAQMMSVAATDIATVAGLLKQSWPKEWLAASRGDSASSDEANRNIEGRYGY